MPESVSAAPYVFLSYARCDADRVRPIVAALDAAGVHVWIDARGIGGGESYGQAIVEAIKGSAAVLLLCSSAALASRNVNQEVRLAWAHGRPYLPLLLESIAAIPEELAYWLEGWQRIEVLDRPQDTWLPEVLHALARLGVATPSTPPGDSGLPVDLPPLPPPAQPPHNLPQQPTPFLGRQQQVDEVVSLLRRDDVQLVTLVGPGGTGKTRLALQAAAEVLDEFADGVFFVPLAPLTESHLIPAAIASALSLREEGGQSLDDRLRDFVAAKTLLLVLDNFEHLVEAAPAVWNILGPPPRLKVLATSRMPLNLRAEHEYPVPPLDLPRRKPPPTADQLSQYDAVRLFIERAQAVKPDFAITNDTAPAVAEICWRLDGLPLAIELAAARVRLLSPQAMLARLDQRLPFLTGGARDAPHRQRTLRDTIAWSYDLLQPDDQVLFRRLAIFVAGCTLDGAETVANQDGDLDVFGGLERLSEHSLLRQGEGLGGEPRLMMLETVREYGLERLVASGEADLARERHATHFATFGDHLERKLWSQSVPLLAALEADAGNLRAALGWAAEQAKAETGLRLGLAFGVLALQRELPAEGREWLRRMQALAGGSPPLHARALTTLGWIALFEGDAEAAKDAAKRSVDAAAGESWILANALNLLGSAELAGGSLEEAGLRFEEALALVERDAEAGVWAPPILMNLGRLASARGDVVQARRWYEAALAALPADAATFIRPMALGNLASLAWDDGDRARAARLQREALPLRHGLWDVLALANSLDNASKFAATAGRPVVAARLLGAAAALRRRGNVTIELFNLDDHQALLAQVREQLDAPAFTAAWAQGESLSLDQAMADADAVFAAAAQDDHGTPTVTDGSVFCWGAGAVITDDGRLGSARR